MRVGAKSAWSGLVVGCSLLAYVAYAATTDLPAATSSPVVFVTAPASPTATPSAPTVGTMASSTATDAADYGAGSFQFAVQTHFSQGWSPSVLSLGAAVGVRSLRDTVNWASVEKSRGVYDFSGSPVATLSSFCAGGGKLILTIVPKNTLYDGGKSVYSGAGQAAFANYVAALLGRFGDCVSAIEVGNEINNSGALDYPAGLDPAQTYVASLKALYTTVKPRFPQVALLGGSTNTVGTGFLETLFAAGALPVIDGVAVHPYRSQGEGLDLEINHLRDVMRKYGTPVPIWATEFSYDTTDQRRVAAGLVKSTALLSASGVDHASWYAMIDQSFFPNFGLYTGSTLKPAGSAYATVMQRLFAYGRAVRVDTGDSSVYLYRFGRDRWLVWGAPRTVSFSGSAVSRDILGAQVGGGVVQIGAEPVIVEGATGYSLGETPVVADTLLQWGASPWTYFRRGSDNKDIALGLFDNDFTSWFGDRWSKPLRINNTSAAPAGDAASPMRAIMRYTSPKAQQVDLEACFSKAVSGDGVDYRIELNGVRINAGVLTQKAEIHGMPITLVAGDRLDFSFGPNQTYGGDAFSYRIIMSQRGRGAALVCG